MQSNLTLVFVVQNLSSFSEFCMSIFSKRLHSFHILYIHPLSVFEDFQMSSLFFHNFV